MKKVNVNSKPILSLSSVTMDNAIILEDNQWFQIMQLKY